MSGSSSKERGLDCDANEEPEMDEEVSSPGFDRDAELAQVAGAIEARDRELIEDIERLRSETARRHKDERIRYFRPHKKQDAFTRSTAKVRCCLGGNRSGKTEIGAAETYAHSQGERPWLRKNDPAREVLVPGPNGTRRPIPIPNHGLIVGESFGEQVRKVLGKKLLGDVESGVGGLIPKDKIKFTKKNQQGIVTTIGFMNGSTISMKSYEQDADLFESEDYDYIWLDEPPPRAHFVAMKRGLTDKDGPMWVTMTPLKEAWFFEEVVCRDDVESWNMAIDDNVGFGLTREGADEFISYLTDDEVEMRRYGRFFHLIGLVYKNFGAVHVISRHFDKRSRRAIIPNTWNLCMAIDPHLEEPHRALWVAVPPNGHYIVCGELINTDPQNLNSAFAEEILRYESQVLGYDSNDLEIRIIDPFAKANNPNDGVSIQEDFDDHGIPTIGGSKDRDSAIQLTRQLLRHEPDAGIFPKLFVFDDLIELQRELRMYKWKEHSKSIRDRRNPPNEPVKKNDHLIECLHRIVMWGPKPRLDSMIPYGPEDMYQAMDSEGVSDGY